MLIFTAHTGWGGEVAQLLNNYLSLEHKALKTDEALDQALVVEVACLASVLMRKDFSSQGLNKVHFS